jgi:hypothetical protein
MEVPEMWEYQTSSMKGKGRQHGGNNPLKPDYYLKNDLYDFHYRLKVFLKEESNPVRIEFQYFGFQ